MTEISMKKFNIFKLSFLKFYYSGQFCFKILLFIVCPLPYLNYTYIYIYIIIHFCIDHYMDNKQTENQNIAIYKYERKVAFSLI